MSPETPLTDLRGYILSSEPFLMPKVEISHWYDSLGAFQDAYDHEARYAIVVDGDPASYVARDIRLGTQTGDPDRPALDRAPATTLDARLDFLTDDGAEEGVDLKDVRAIGLVDDSGGIDGE